MKDLLVAITKRMVDHPDQVSVKETGSERTILLELSIAKKDSSIIIGNKGRTIDAIRTIVNAVSGKLNKRVIIEVME